MIPRFCSKSTILIASAAIGFLGFGTHAKSTSVGESSSGSQRKIAIIGGGIGGTSCAYFLRELFKEQRGDQNGLQIDTFERDPRLGGRLATVDMGGHQYESGGSIIHKRNRYMSKFVDQFGLKKRDYSSPGSSDDDLFGLFDGERFVFRESSWSFVTVLKLLWRYRWDVVRLERSLERMLAKFDRIYDLQDRGFAYTSIEKLLEAMSPELAGNLKISFRSYLEMEGFSELFATELADAAVRVNYGQNLNVTAFVGSVALAGAQKGLWSVENGNRLVTERLFEHSDSTLHNYEVRKIIRNPDDSKFTIICTKSDGDQLRFDDYDAVVLAVPLIDGGASRLEFENFKLPASQYGPYHRLIATFVEGRLNDEMFGACSKDDGKKSILFAGDRCPQEVLVCKNDRLWFNSVGALKPVDIPLDQIHRSSSLPDKESADRIYKVFSTDRLSDAQLNQLFARINSTKIVDWLAYPHYENRWTTDDRSKDEEGVFEPSDRVYHINQIEWAASAMEMSVIGARNVALLIHAKLGMGGGGGGDSKVVRVDQKGWKSEL